MNLNNLLLAVSINEAMKAAFDQGYVAGGGDTTIQPGTPEMDAYAAYRAHAIKAISGVLAQGGVDGLRALKDADPVTDDTEELPTAANEG